jgi:hypothetical protein
MSSPAFITILTNLEECHADIKFARQLRQDFNRTEAVSASRYRGRERDGDITCSFDLRRQTLFGP